MVQCVPELRPQRPPAQQLHPWPVVGNVGVAEQPVEQPELIHPREALCGSSWAARLDDRAELRVQTVTLSVLFARHALESVDLLKFDIEGAELDEMLVARLEPAFDVETRPLEPRWLLRARRRASRP